MADSYSHASRGSGYGYSLAMPKSYGTDTHMESYLMKGKKGLAGYVDNFVRYSLGSIKAGYSYSAPKKEEFYKAQEMMKNYELKLFGGGGLGVMMPAVQMYDLSSMRRPVLNLEKRLNLN